MESIIWTIYFVVFSFFKSFLQFTGSTYKLQHGENFFVIDALLCIDTSINKGCKKSTSSSKCKHFIINSIEDNQTSDELKERNTETVPNSVCLQKYSNYSIFGNSYEVPSGCKCHEIKFK